MSKQFIQDKRRKDGSPRIQVLATQSGLLVPAVIFALQGTSLAARDPFRALIVGGGPSPTSNQVAIESNVRYVTKLLPKGTESATFFADGDASSRTVVYRPAEAAKSAEEQVLDSLLRNPQQTRGRRNPGDTRNTSTNQPNSTGSTTPQSPPPPTGGDTPAPAATPAPINVPSSAGNFKAPEITKLDGPSKKENLETAFQTLSGQKPRQDPLFLYFTGHGSQTRENQENNYYNLWSGGKFTVQDLAGQISRLPEQQPVVLVMVQCYSGSFANVLFENGDPKANQIKRPLVGFFASTKDRVAAGCTPAVNEEYYYDFTSYFFSALTGRDRLNRNAAPDADYNGDGKVGLDEAFYWSVINDNSIDVPVATSDVFLEKFSPLDGEAWKSTPFSLLLSWASPAQRAALEGLSQSLGVTGENRILDIQALNVDTETNQLRDLIQALNQKLRPIREEQRKSYLESYPALANPAQDGYKEARARALDRVGLEIVAGQWQSYLDTTAELNKLQARSNGTGVKKARQLRFNRLAQKVARDHNLRSATNPELVQRYEALLQNEAQVLLPYQGGKLRQASITRPSGTS